MLELADCEPKGHSEFAEPRCGGVELDGVSVQQGVEAVSVRVEVRRAASGGKLADDCQELFGCLAVAEGGRGFECFYEALLDALV